MDVKPFLDQNVKGEGKKEQESLSVDQQSSGKKVPLIWAAVISLKWTGNYPGRNVFN